MGLIVKNFYICNVKNLNFCVTDKCQRKLLLTSESKPNSNHFTLMSREVVVYSFIIDG